MRLLLKNDGVFAQTGYSQEQAAVLLKPFSSILSGEGLDEIS
jgi:hypothetical protein